MVLAALVVCMACVQGCGSAAAPRDYYFSPRGSDADGLGTPDRPYQSVAKASDLRLNPGDRVLFEGGQDFTGNLTLDARDAGTADQPVQVGSYGDGRATIRAGGGTAVLVHNAGGVHVRDLVVVGDGRGKSNGSGVEFLNTLPGGKRLAHVRIDNVEARGFGKEGIFVHGAPDDWSPSGFADVRITRCAARDNVHTGIYVTGFWDGWRKTYANQDVYVGHCLAADNLGDPNAVRENRTGSGIFVEGSERATIEYSEATGNGRLNRGHHGGPVGIWATVSTGVTIQFCRSHHNRTGGGHDGGGFCLDGGVSRSVMQHNLSHDNDGSGFGLFEYAGAPPAHGNVIRHNVSRNDGRRNAYAGIHVWDGGDGIAHVQIHNNEVTMTPATGVAAQPPRAIWFQTPVRDARVTNNRFVTEPGVRLIDVAHGQRGVEFRDNEYLAKDAGPPESGKVAIDWEGQTYLSLDAWRKATGQDAKVLSASSVTPAVNE